jgi:hypothetical protein
MHLRVSLKTMHCLPEHVELGSGPVFAVISLAMGMQIVSLSSTLNLPVFDSIKLIALIFGKISFPDYSQNLTKF